MGRIRSTNQVETPSWQRYAVPPHVEAVLVNWGLWAAGREGRSGRHTNAMFTAATRGLRWQPCSTGGTTRLDADEAWRAERVICDPVFSPRFRTLLVEHYAHQRRERDTCKLLFIAWGAYDAELFKAAMSFWARFERASSKPC